MNASDVLDLLDALDGLGVRHWVDGGWGVDGLLGEQTRPHGDLDLVVPRPDLERVRAELIERGYEVLRDWLPTSLAFRHPSGREVDLHPVDPTLDGGGDQVLPDGTSWHYAAPIIGTIAGRPTPCAPAEDQLQMHLGYDPRPVDLEDMARLAARFGLALPPSLERQDQ
ncbi:MAG: hypothetical protein JOZ82_05900 [Marmoricola sp.]|nr:hypothetical protein [Marmoricola sp.]